MCELEFLPAEYLRARYQRRIGFLRSWLLLALGSAMVLWSFQVGSWVRDARAELESLRGADTAVEADVSKVRLLRAEAQGYHQRIALVQALRPQITGTAVLGVMTNLLPAGVHLEDISLDCAGRTGSGRALLRMRGVAPREAAVTQMLEALEADPAFESAVLVESKPYGRDEADRRFFAVEVAVAPVVSAKEQTP